MQPTHRRAQKTPLQEQERLYLQIDAGQEIDGADKLAV